MVMFKPRVLTAATLMFLTFGISIVILGGILSPGLTQAPLAGRLLQPPVKQSMQAAELILKEEKGWTKDYEQYFGTKFSIQFREAKLIRKTLKSIARQTGKRSAVIYLVPTPEQLEVLLVTPGAKPIRQSFPMVKQREVKAIAKILRQEVGNPNQVDTTQYLEASQQLYQWFIKPVEKQLQRQKIDTLLFCVGGGLRSLPLAALHDGKQFLVEKYNIGLIPAFSLIDLRYTKLQDAKVLAMGASEFQDLSPLPGVPQELAAITQSQGGTSFLNNQFTVENLQAQRQKQDYGIVHLATHARFQPGMVDNSYLQFWDQKVSLNQLPKLQLRLPILDLLVLSACQTALGDPQAELGFAGLAIQSGAKSVLGTLWNVSDEGTLQLMSRFYKYLKVSPIKAEALRKAQIETLQQKEFSHPYYWSAFTMIGSPW